MSAQMPTTFGNGQPSPWMRPGFGQLPPKLSALARVAAHDMYHGLAQDGQSYADGSIYMAAIFTPDDGAVSSLMEKDATREALFEYAQWDLQDDGIANGSPAAQIMADFHWYQTGESIHHQVMNGPKHQFTWDLLDTPTPDNASVDGFQVQADWLGLSKYEMAAVAWSGHDNLPHPLDDGWWNGSGVLNAMDNPMNPDYTFTNGVSGLRDFAQHLVDWDTQHFGEMTGYALNWWATQGLVKMFNR